MQLLHAHHCVERQQHVAHVGALLWDLLRLGKQLGFEEERQHVADAFEHGSAFNGAHRLLQRVLLVRHGAEVLRLVGLRSPFFTRGVVDRVAQKAELFCKMAFFDFFVQNGLFCFLFNLKISI